MKRRALAWLLALGMTALLLTGCGGSGGSTSSMATAPEAYDDAGGVQDYDYMATETPMEAKEARESETQGGEVLPEKLIYTAHLDLETTAFDDAVASIAALTEGFGGYYESSSVNNYGSGYRYANYTVRIPTEHYADFLAQAGAVCHQLSKEEFVENVSESYYDTAGRLKTQETKLERLQTLLAQAETMEDIITIESAISDTEQQIESLSGTLRRYDALVRYSTVHIALQEVYTLSNVEQPVTGFGSRLGTAFASGWKNFVSGMENLAVSLAYSWMWLLILAAVAVVVIRSLRKRKQDRGEVKKPERASFWTPHQKKDDDKPE